jgi:DNA-binding NarL/FixJ family response regulator
VTASLFTFSSTSLFAYLTSPPFPNAPALGPRQASKQAFDGLSQREREVAALVAQGYSNHRIADALTLSERTVEKHVENIMSKLHINSRAQIAAWAVTKHLTHP